MTLWIIVTICILVFCGICFFVLKPKNNQDDQNGKQRMQTSIKSNVSDTQIKAPHPENTNKVNSFTNNTSTTNLSNNNSSFGSGIKVTESETALAQEITPSSPDSVVNVKENSNLFKESDTFGNSVSYPADESPLKEDESPSSFKTSANTSLNQTSVSQVNNNFNQEVQDSFTNNSIDISVS